MKSICFFFFLLMTVNHLASSNIADATSIPTSLDDNSIKEKKPMRKLSFVAPNFKKNSQEMEVAGGETKRTVVEKEEVVEELKGGDEGEELVYNVDYSGVTTHPTPKHPKP